MSTQCPSCGRTLDNIIALCPQCLRKKHDYEQFSIHHYTREELSAIPIGHYATGYAKWGFIRAFIVIGLALLGSIGGALLGRRGGAAVGGHPAAGAGTSGGFIVGVLVGFIVGVVIVRLIWRAPNMDERYPSLKARLDGMYSIGAIFGGAFGTLAGLIAAAAMGYLKREYGAMPFAPAVVMGALLAVCGGILAVAFNGQKCKDSLLTNFEQWLNEPHVQDALAAQPPRDLNA